MVVVGIPVPFFFSHDVCYLRCVALRLLCVASSVCSPRVDSIVWVGLLLSATTLRSVVLRYTVNYRLRRELQIPGYKVCQL